MADELIRVGIAIDDKGGNRKLATANRGLDRLDAATKRSTASMKRLGAAFVATFGAYRVIAGMRSVVEAFAQQEEAVTGLRAALRATGKDGAASLKLLTDRAAELQRITTKGDEAIIAATGSLALLANQLQASELAQAQTALIGIADVFLKGDVENAAQLLGKTLGSTTNALTRYGIQVDMTANQSEKLRQVIQQTNAFFAVSVEKTETLAGRAAQLSNAWGDLKEKMGEFLGGEGWMTSFLTRMTTMFSDIAQILNGQKDQVREMFRALGDIAGSAFAGGVMAAFGAGSGTKLFRNFFFGRAEAAMENIAGSMTYLSQLAEQIRSATPRAGGGGPVMLPGITVTGRRPSLGGGGGGGRPLTGRIGPVTPSGPPVAGISWMERLYKMNAQLAQMTGVRTEAERDAAMAAENSARAQKVLAVAGIHAAASLGQMIAQGGSAGGILGGILSVGGGVLGVVNPIAGAALVAGGSLLRGLTAPSNRVQPVSVERYGAQALAQERDQEQIINFTAIIESGGVEVKKIVQQIRRLQARDGYVRIPAGAVI